MYRLIVAGTRTFDDYYLLEKEADSFIDELKIAKEDIIIMSGMARGADELGLQYATNHKLQVEHYPAKWAQYGSKAGPLRNKWMAEQCDACIVFWDNKSKGTSSLRSFVTKLNKPLKTIIYKEVPVR